MSFSSDIKEEIEKQKVFNNKSNMTQQEQILLVTLIRNTI